MKRLLIAFGLAGLVGACVPASNGYYGSPAGIVVAAPVGYGYGYGYSHPYAGYGHGYYRRPAYYGGSSYRRQNYGQHPGVRYGRAPYSHRRYHY
jgi:hypothetical protein